MSYRKNVQGLDLLIAILDIFFGTNIISLLLGNSLWDGVDGR